MMKIFSERLDSYVKGSAARLDGYIPNVTREISLSIRRPTLVICPGGAYIGCSEREAEPVALRFLAKGFNVFILWYREKPDLFPMPQREILASVKMIRDRAEEWHCDPERIAVMGFSAGGHLAASSGTLFEDEEVLSDCPFSSEEVRPNALLLSYPVINSGEYAHVDSFNRLCGDKADKASLSLEKRVFEKTPPTFIWHTAADNVVPVENSLLFASALSRYKIPFELHVYPKGGHGLSCADETSGPVEKTAAGWVELAVDWLKRTFA